MAVGEVSGRCVAVLRSIQCSRYGSCCSLAAGSRRRRWPDGIFLRHGAELHCTGTRLRVCRRPCIEEAGGESLGGWDGQSVNTIPPIQQNSMKNGYDENKVYGESYENKCATNYSIITNNNWNNTHKKQLTMHNKYTNDDVDFDALSVHMERTDPHPMMTPHTSVAQVLSNHIVISIPSMARFDSTSPFFLYFSFLPFSVFFLCPELFLKLDNPIVMASLRCAAADESEDTLNSSSLTQVMSPSS